MSYLRYMCLFGSSLPPVVCRRAHVLFTLFVFVCVYWCPTHIVLCVLCFFFLRLVCCVISLDCPFLIDPSVFSKVYLLFITGIRCFTRPDIYRRTHAEAYDNI